MGYRVRVRVAHLVGVVHRLVPRLQQEHETDLACTVSLERLARGRGQGQG